MEAAIGTQPYNTTATATRPYEAWPTTGAPLLACGRINPADAKNTRRESRIISHHDRQPLGGAGNARVEPAVTMLAEGKAFIEQDDVLPLRALGLVDRQRIPVIELVRIPPHLRT